MINVRKIFFIVLLLLLLIPICEACDDNNTHSQVKDDYNQIMTEVGDSEVNSNLDDDTLGEDESYKNSVYFDSSVSDDRGNGSRDNPYQKLTTQRIGRNNNIYLADGEYKLNSVLYAHNITFIGESVENTIIKDSSFKNYNNSLTIYNLTLANCEINGNATLSINNMIFANTSKHINYLGNEINLDNVSFINCSNEIGGAIYARDTIININNSLFTACTGIDAACLLARNSNLSISNTIFYDNHSDNLGGAIIALTTNTKLANVTFTNNSAKYYGGCLYSIYGSMKLENSLLENNNANDGASLYIDDCNPCTIENNRFINHTGNSTSIIYMVSSNATNDILEDNIFSNNTLLNLDKQSIPNTHIGNANYTLINYNYTVNDTLPSTYDLRKLGYVTSVKDQASDGNCWAFATLATLESCLLKTTNVTYDLSEQNLKNIMAQYSDYGWSMDVNEGGKYGMSFGYLTSWLGPVYDYEDIYRLGSLLSPVLNSSIHIQNIIFITRNNHTDNDELKRALMTYGSVSSFLAWNFAYVKNSNYYYNEIGDMNHEVSIVGWDDNYSRYNFKYTPEADGAWIVKNSWGNNSGEDGYYYISYYDMNHALGNQIYTFSFNDETVLENNYQYDIGGITDYYYFESNTVWYKNIYTIESNEYLEAVSTYFNARTNYTLSIYLNDEEKIVRQNTTNSGYYTIYLDEKIAMHKNDKLEIIFKITTEDDIAIPISEIYSLKKQYYHENISYFSLDGINWNDLYQYEGEYPGHIYASQVASIKAFTQNIRLSLNLTANNKNPYEFTAKVYDQYSNIINNGSICFIINGEKTNVTITNQTAKITRNLSTGINNITAIYNAEGYNQAQDNMTINITDTTKKDPKITLTYTQEDKILKLKLIVTDENNNPINSGKVVFKINGKTIKDSAGKIIYAKVIDSTAQVNYTIPDSYIGKTINITAVYSGTTTYNKKTTNTTITITKQTPTLKTQDITANAGSTITLTATITSDKPVNTGKVIFKINGKTLKDADGKIISITVTDNVASIQYTIPDTFKIKNYTITAIYVSATYGRMEDTKTLTII